MGEIRCRCSFRVIAWSGRMDRWRDLPGDARPNSGCWRWKAESHRCLPDAQEG